MTPIVPISFRAFESEGEGGDRLLSPGGRPLQLPRRANARATPATLRRQDPRPAGPAAGRRGGAGASTAQRLRAPRRAPPRRRVQAVVSGTARVAVAGSGRPRPACADG